MTDVDHIPLTFHTRIHAYQAFQRDEFCLTVYRYEMRGEKCVRTLHLTNDGQWVEHRGFEEVPPTLRIPGYVDAHIGSLIDKAKVKDLIWANTDRTDQLVGALRWALAFEDA